MYPLAYAMDMLSRVSRGRWQARTAVVSAVLLAFVDPVAAQGTAGLGSSTTLGAVVSVTFLLGICTVLLFSLGRYTRRTSDIIITSPVSTLATGFGASVALSVPFALVAVLAEFVGTPGLLGLSLLTALSLPLLTLVLVGVGIGAIAAGRHVSDKNGVVLLVVTLLAVPVGAFPLPLLAVAVVLSVLGLGAMLVDFRHDNSDTDTTDRETYGKQHRYT